MSQVYNKSKQVYESAEYKKCPRCKGFGSIAFEDDSRECHICEGHGSAWVSKEGSGWTRAYRKHLRNSLLY